ncbi:hypothetical protein MIND_00744400 [Mycena indigotica]|uniref:Metal homeostatis protein bsd2 n=1 Tax=Mycena indigotica TaxID=2126181 RepID=A0A8H6W1Q3_9AGAR|nr:uncharacterized protein MIND_00744400 [Mycena indigotica]KAF7301787.1 hypothetical protein MIND_00744400 [Mycena indigotica]
MSGRYAPLPNNNVDEEGRNEMDAAFDDSDDEDENRPLNPTPSSPVAATHVSRASTHIPGTYNFEVDYDMPPPGSPPGPSSTALPNEHGNSNGFIPNFASAVDSVSRGPRLGWFKRAATAVLPTHYVQRLGMSGADRNVMGTNNDGVFANVTAKPTPPVRIQDGDSTYIVPEEVRAEAPPSYASAQADAVPQYYEVHAPFTPGTAGEMIIDNLPSGTLFSFLWNMLVSISFQFVGFLLTYLLHTTHAARLGARAGLGVTLIQYGFALRTRNDGTEEEAANAWASWSNQPTFATEAEAAAYYNGTSTDPTALPTLTPEQANAIVADATSEWLSFFLMTIGWFILLTSVLGFWRVKRWERGVLASQRETPGSAPAPLSAGPFLAQFERGFGLRGISQADFFRQGFGFGPRSEERERERARDHADGEAEETEFMIPADADPERAQQLQEAINNERRLHAELRAAGLL